MPTDVRRPGPLGVYLPTFPQDPATDVGVLLERTSVLAEALGADALWAADHLFWGQPCVEALVAATVAATATERVLVGTSVLQAPLRQTAALAKAVASLQVVAGGRVVLGLGVGSHEGEYAAAAADFTTRGARLDQQLDELAALWSPGGERYEQRPAPTPVPLWFGGAGPHVVRRVVSHGEGWTSAFLRPKAFAEHRDRLHEALDHAGRDPAEVTCAATVPVFVAPRDGVGRALDHLSAMYDLDRRLFLGQLAAGSAAECVERILRFRDAGADHVAVVVPADDPRPHLDAVVPLLAEALG